MDGIHAIEGKVKDGYKLYGSEKLFDSVVYPGLGHVYVPEMWEKMLNWIDGNLREAKYGADRAFRKSRVCRTALS